MTISDFEYDAIASEVIVIFKALNWSDGNHAPAITRVSQVCDQKTGLLFAIHQIGVTLNAIGGQGLVHKVISEVEDRLDDWAPAVFLNRRWDGYPRP